MLFEHLIIQLTLLRVIVSANEIPEQVLAECCPLSIQLVVILSSRCIKYEILVFIELFWTPHTDSSICILLECV